MKDRIDLKIDITDNSDIYLRASDEAIERALAAIGLQAEGYAKLKCPVDTGRLRGSITESVEMEEKAVYVGSNVEYAPYVELGTRKMKAQPYIKPAVVDHADEYKKIALEFLKD